MENKIDILLKILNLSRLLDDKNHSYILQLFYTNLYKIPEKNRDIKLLTIFYNNDSLYLIPNNFIV